MDSFHQVPRLRALNALQQQNRQPDRHDPNQYKKCNRNDSLIIRSFQELLLRLLDSNPVNYLFNFEI